MNKLHRFETALIFCLNFIAAKRNLSCHLLILSGNHVQHSNMKQNFSTDNFNMKRVTNFQKLRAASYVNARCHVEDLCQIRFLNMNITS
jgi:hypothetical protein